METEAAAEAMAYDAVIPETLVILSRPDRPPAAARAAPVAPERSE